MTKQRKKIPKIFLKYLSDISQFSENRLVWWNNAVILILK